ncbi:peroxide stress protein YaaA [Micromonospora sp. U21]|uniref:peroxide stress protein YaaA n=1 Tax=Micromonospora sp. U21 TaxID=2824899 RepID=UPI001B37F194|nr:peroxide stress protein YaaA [Micromonospora sp. U21]MBQ0901410.1 peroxide stress protein YaaA [Micromonospora sp. U21]
MLILLPPSEGKADAGTGRRWSPDRLALPELNPAREQVLDALVALSAGPDEAAARVALGLSEGQRGELRRNARLRVAATAPAAQVYTGVLYEALDLASLPAAAQRTARRSILISSGLWGAVRLADRIPPYRCPIGARLPGVGALSAYWRPVLAPVLSAAAGSGPVLDLRSGAYAATWTPRGELAERTVTLRVLHEREVDGVPVRSVVSHFNKATKGRLVRDLLVAGARPRTAAELIGALRELKHTVVEQAAGPGRPRQVDLVATDL